MILSQMDPDERRTAYNADITYGTNNEFGFDYLRDNMAHRLEELVQRGHSYAIVDEVDSILIDEARTPLDHLRAGRRRVELVHRVRPDRAADGEGQPLRGRPAQAHDRRARVRCRVRRRPARHRQPLRGGQLAAGQLPQQRAEGQGAVPARQGLHRPRRRSADRRRVHRTCADRPPLQRGHAPGHRGQGKRGDQGREPDAGHDHAAELLPPLRQAGGDDRHRPDRGRRVARDLQARRGIDPDQQADDPRRPIRPHLQDRGSQVHRGRRRRRRAVREGPAGPDRHHQRGTLRVPVAAVPEAAHSAQRAQRQVPRAGGRDHRRGRPARRDHRRHQHGRPRHRHRARRQRRLPDRHPAARTRPRSGRDARRVRGRAGTRSCPRSRPRRPTRPKR